MGRATIEQIAQALGMNVRTLQRRLDDSGRTFSDLINEVRRELVLRYMENSRYPLSRIAELLGYSMLSSFTRWFTAQFGVAPVVWRANTALRRPGIRPLTVHESPAASERDWCGRYLIESPPEGAHLPVLPRDAATDRSSESQ